MLAARNGASSAVEYVPCRLQRVAVGSRFDDDQAAFLLMSPDGLRHVVLGHCVHAARQASVLHVTVYADDRQDSGFESVPEIQRIGWNACPGQVERLVGRQTNP